MLNEALTKMCATFENNKLNKINIRIILFCLFIALLSNIVDSFVRTLYVAR